MRDKTIRKITPVKSITLCEKCKYGKNHTCWGNPLCKGCERVLPPNEGYCKCRKIKPGTPCPDFVRAAPEEPRVYMIKAWSGAATVSITTKGDFKNATMTRKKV